MLNHRVAVAVGVTALLLSALITPSAHAIGSLGASQRCDSDGHCVVGNAASANAHVTVTAVGAAADPAVAYCSGSGTGATLIEITCSIGNQSETMSFPGSKGIVPVIASSQTLTRLPVCWEVTGYFPTITGPQHIVPTSGCALVAA